MTHQTVLAARIRNRHDPSPRRRHPLRWVLGAASPPSGPAGGTWQVAAGSVAGFRVPESALGFSNDVVGRTTAVSGAIIISGDRVTSAALRIALIGIKVSGKAQPQLGSSLSTRRFPAATFTLTRPVTLGAAFASGATVTTTAVGELTMNGTAHLVQVTLSGRRDGPLLQAGVLLAPACQARERQPAATAMLARPF